MSAYHRNNDRKPSGRFGKSFESDRPRGKFDRNSRGAAGRFSGRSEGRSEWKHSRDSDASYDRPRERSPSRFSRDTDRPARQPLEMHPAICDQCGRECQLPFQPTRNKPVYCSDCFRSKDDAPTLETAPAGRSRSSTDELTSIHAKLDKIMQALKIR